MRSRRLTTVWTASLVLGFGLLAACSNPFAPPRTTPGGVAPIALQTSPDSVLVNFRYSYERNDIDTYENCLDDEFIFIYLDQDRQGDIVRVEVPRDGQSGDIARTARMFEAFDEILLDTWIISPPIDPQPEYPSDWQARSVTFHLFLRDLDGDFGYQAVEATGYALFHFRQSPVDGFWRIVVWEDRSVL